MTSAFSMPPMRCSRPGVPGTAHGRARVSGSRRYGWKTVVALGVGAVGLAWRSSTREVGQVGDRPGSPTARSRWRGSRRTGGSTGVRYVVAMRTASIAASKQSAGDRGATIGDRATRRCGRTSPGAGRPARSWSAGRSRGRRAGRRQMTSGSSSETARPIVSDFSATPGPRGRRDADGAAERGAERGADAGDLVLGLHRRHAEPLEAGERVEDVGGRGDRVGAEDERAARPGAPRRRGRRPGRRCR